MEVGREDDQTRVWKDMCLLGIFSKASVNTWRIRLDEKTEWWWTLEWTPDDVGAGG